MAIEAPDILGPGSSVHEIKKVWFWGLFTNEVLKLLEIGQKSKWLGLVWFGNVKVMSLVDL